MRILTAMAFALTALAPAAPVLAQDTVGFDRGSFGRVVLNRKQSAGGSSGDVQLELSVGQYNNESIENYSPESIFAKMGHAVGRLDILTDTGIFPCTAFIVSDKHILTNYHCVPGIVNNADTKATRIDAVQFVAGYTRQGVEEGTRTFTVSPTPIEAHEDLDYAVLEVLGNPSAAYGTLALSDEEPNDGDPYWVIGHPMGEAQRISREQCRANKPALSGHELLHTCDTLPGNSGSPVIDASLQMVVGLHHAGSKRDSVNFAIPMRDILKRSQVLEVALRPVPGAGTGGQPPKTDATPVPAGDAGKAAMCDAFYTEAKTTKQCFAYRAYLESCGSHAYAIFAQRYIDSECATAAATPKPEATQPVTPVYTPPAQPQPAPQPAPQLLRPWCGGSLNPTEWAICNDAYLAGLDSELENAYRATGGRVTSADQGNWLTSARNACGSDANCIAQRTVERITYLKTPAPAPQRLLRPWCGGTLNATERAICNDPYLAGLDADLENAYKAASGRVSPAEQSAWLKAARNACGSDGACIAQRTAERITFLRAAPRATPQTGGTRLVQGNYTLVSSQCYIVTASRTSIAEAQDFIRQWFPGQRGVRMFQSTNGYYAVVYETAAKSQSDWRLNQLKSQRAVPGDSYCSSGNRFVAEVLTSGALTRPDSGTRHAGLRPGHLSKTPS